MNDKTRIRVAYLVAIEITIDVRGPVDVDVDVAPAPARVAVTEDRTGSGETAVIKMELAIRAFQLIMATSSGVLSTLATTLSPPMRWASTATSAKRKQ
ncbi:hypothetical protein BZM27_44330 [Paraburkholderia steynii]|uniref:Uncharacterized protein n=1 Tax=Paraburkholderia steynii TaxID=1245441 RepID=A0A4R0X5B2_9BURK|nr:hypothetical protein BZM27_44330 [Paraburkholderia steynii]